MKKQAKKKSAAKKKTVSGKPRKAGKGSKAPTLGDAVMPSLVEAMTKLVERLESLEIKTDKVMNFIAGLPTQIKQMMVNLPRSEGADESGTTARVEPGHGKGGKERILYKVICADCRKPCEVPFKPAPGRQVYCRECFHLRKTGHTPVEPEYMERPKPRPFTPPQIDYTEPPPAPSKGGVAVAAQKKKKRRKK